jgi:hypothetical protein
VVEEEAFLSWVAAEEAEVVLEDAVAHLTPINKAMEDQRTLQKLNELILNCIKGFLSAL